MIDPRYRGESAKCHASGFRYVVDEIVQKVVGSTDDKPLPTAHGFADEGTDVVGRAIRVDTESEGKIVIFNVYFSRMRGWHRAVFLIAEKSVRDLMRDKLPKNKTKKHSR
jgi:hypothetical protein